MFSTCAPLALRPYRSTTCGVRRFHKPFIFWLKVVGIVVREVLAAYHEKSLDICAEKPNTRLTD